MGTVVLRCVLRRGVVEGAEKVLEGRNTLDIRPNEPWMSAGYAA